MESKRDIYNLWIIYTTQNDERSFRDFISGFVAIWEGQLHLDSPVHPENVAATSGPHIKRLPDELIPAIQKFLIIAKTSIVEQNRDVEEQLLTETELLLRCLVVIARHFDNIPLILRSNFVNVCADICLSLGRSKRGRSLSAAESNLFRACCRLLEVLYDPYQTWWHYVDQHEMYRPAGAPLNPALHPEIVPLIYNCLESDDEAADDSWSTINSIGYHLLNVLGSIISGSTRNSAKVICPATANIVGKLLSSWRCDPLVRQRALVVYNVMLQLLNKSDPVERQIDLRIVIRIYQDAIESLLKSSPHIEVPKEQQFVLDSNDERGECWDMGALMAMLKNVGMILYEPSTRVSLARVLIESGLLTTIVAILDHVQAWYTSRLQVAAGVMEALRTICHAIHDYLMPQKLIERLLRGIRSLGVPKSEIVEQSLKLCVHPLDPLVINCSVLSEMIRWLPDLSAERDQEFISSNVVGICSKNANCIIAANEKHLIRTTATCLLEFKNLSSRCVTDLIRLISILAKFSIGPCEFRHVLKLFNDELAFTHRFELLAMMSDIMADALVHHSTVKDFWNVQRVTEGISVPEIHQWTVAGGQTTTSGFVFHASVRLGDAEANNNECNSSDQLGAKYFFRRQLFHLLTAHGASGFEIFVSQDGSVTVAAIVKKDYFAITCSEAKLFDNKWHTLTVAIVPSKRPFSYFNVTIHKDGELLTTASLKMSTVQERFVFCNIGTPITSHHSDVATAAMAAGATPSKSLLPSLFEKAPNYFTLPLKGFSQDSAVKSIANGLQDNIFGAPTSLQGQLGSVLLAESGFQLRTLFEMGHQFASVISHESVDSMDQLAKVVFCYSPAASFDNRCMDLSASRKMAGQMNGRTMKCQRVTSVHDALQNIGGISIMLPLLECFEGGNDDDPLLRLGHFSCYDNRIGSTELREFEGRRLAQNPIAQFLVILKYCLNEKRIVQDCNDYVPLINVMLQNCDPQHLDVDALMAVQILVEALVKHQQQQFHMKESGVLDTTTALVAADCYLVNQFVDILYEHLVYNFKIWSRAPFQIIIGHVQYLQTLIKTDRKLFRTKYGVQFVLDTIRGYFVTPNNITESDGKAIRMAFLDIIRVYISKQISIKEVKAILSFLATMKNETALIELLNMLSHHMDTNCKDQIFLLFLEPDTAELIYCLLIDRTFGPNLHEAVFKFMWRLIQTKWVSGRHKLSLYLYSVSVQCKSLYPGLLSYLMPHHLNDDIILVMFDQLLAINTPSGYCGVISMINHLQYHNLNLKLEIGRRLLTAVFTNKHAPVMIAQQLGWQHSITKLFVKKSIGTNTSRDVYDHDTSVSGMDQDIIIFDKDDTVSERQNSAASDTESHSMLDNSTLLADDVDSMSLHSVETLSEISTNMQAHKQLEADNRSGISIGECDLKQDPVTILNENLTVTEEEQLVYLLTNIIFTILWRGIGAAQQVDPWKEEGQIVAAINLLALNNELYCSHLILRLRLLEMKVQACLIEIGDTQDTDSVSRQRNAAQLLRMVYDLAVLDQNEDDSKKCSVKLLDGVLSIVDSLAVFQNVPDDDWQEMKWVCLGLLIKCAQSPDTAIVAMATAKLQQIFQSHSLRNMLEAAYAVHKLNDVIGNVMNVDEFSYPVSVMRVLLEKSDTLLGLSENLPDLPPLESGPDFHVQFQSYHFSKEWKSFISKRIKPLHDAYQREIETTLWEPLNIFWAECYEACKKASHSGKEIEMESRHKFQEKVMLPWRHRQQEEVLRQNGLVVLQKSEEGKLDLQHRQFKRIFYSGAHGPWQKR